MPIEDILNDLDELRADIGNCLSKARVIGDKIARGTGGREVSLAITQIQQGGHWLREASDLLTKQSIAEMEAEHNG